MKSEIENIAKKLPTNEIKLLSIIACVVSLITIL